VACLALPPGSPTPSLATIRDFCSRTLPRVWAPRGVVVVDVLPLLPGGKLDRAALSALAAQKHYGER
jgi:acyl-CoA synthetase (AMP-forming)/AMP-acid ligase II